MIPRVTLKRVVICNPHSTVGEDTVMVLGFVSNIVVAVIVMKVTRGRPTQVGGEGGSNSQRVFLALKLSCKQTFGKTCFARRHSLLFFLCALFLYYYYYDYYISLGVGGVVSWALFSSFYLFSIYH